ncbi:DUF308 domain-containing protein [Ideonella azotifigens]|uniref:T6SS effector BTH_I2691 family protein n=1 Tax=Ideonella azotifigens TaxID=513160 RepID=A0ABP3VRU1_9BURK|nr:T6SS effector BTH_I2691 family protein [Ideonella azotifigens]MCD2339613.1 DUF308 domain-containing protein [Ideonella azotifigens]
MSTFKPGWYEVARDPKTGNVKCWHFTSPTSVTAECHLTPGGLQILHWTTKTQGHEKGMSARWQASYKYLPSEAGGQWDNQNASQSAKKAGAAAAAPARSPCDDLSNKCDLCDRRGLLLFPALYAVARTDVMLPQPVPPLRAPFGAGLAAYALPPALTQYTLRTVRPGYLYLFNEKLGDAGWKGYQVSAKGYLFEFNLDQAAPPADAPQGEPCGRRPGAQAARCIALPNAKHIGNVYLTFSDTPWTPATLKAYKANQDNRRSSMRKIDARAWVDGKGATTQPHVGSPLAHLDAVAEFSQQSNNVLAWFSSNLPHPAFSDSLTRFESLAMTKDGFVQALSKVSDGVPPMMVALDDPTGIAADLNQQILNRLVAWYEQPERRWKRESAQTVEVLRLAVQNGAVESARDSQQTAGGILLSIMPAHAGPFMRGSSIPEKYGNLRYISEERQDVIGAEEWEKDHVRLYRKTAVDNYLNTEFPKELSDFESQVVRPLDAIYRKWLESDAMAQYFQYNFDPADPENGEAYTLKLSVVLNDASGRRGVWEFISTQLEQDPTQARSLILRALMLNQDAALKEWTHNASGDGGDGKAMQLDPFKWDKIAEKTWGSFKKLAKIDHYKAPVTTPTAMNKSMNAVVRLTQQVAGPMLHKIGIAFDNAAAWTAAKLPEKRLMALLGSLAKAGNPNLVLIDMRAVTTRKMAVRRLADAIAEYSGKESNQYRTKVRTILDEAEELRGTKYAYNAIALVDRVEAESLKEYASRSLRSTRDELVAGRVLQLRQANDMLESGMRNMFARDVKINIAASFFIALTLRSAYTDMAKAHGSEKTTKMVAFAGAIASLSGAIIESVGGALQATSWGAQKLGQPVKFLLNNLDTRAKLLGYGGKVIGAVGGFISGALALKEGYQALGISPTYGSIVIALGLFSIVGAILTLIGYTGPWGFLLSLVVAAIYLVVGYFKPTKVQKWLHKSYWGKHEDGDGFPSLAEELEALKALSET